MSEPHALGIDLASIVTGMIGATVGETDNLVEMGISSLQVMTLVGMLRSAGYDASFAKFMSNPTLESWRQVVEKIPRTRIRRRRRVDVDPHLPFDLTEVQRAYWVGRRPGQYLGQVGCHGYLEVDGHNVDPEQLDRAWAELQRVHPMLRARFTDDGRQQIAEQPGNEPLIVHDLRDLGPDQIAAHLGKLRSATSHRLLDVAAGQVAGLQLSLLPGGATRLHFDIDLLICDVTSYQILLRDLAILYTGVGEVAAPSDWNVAACLESLRVANQQRFSSCEQYWAERLDSFTGAPAIPLAVDPQTITDPRFVRRQHRIPAPIWNEFVNRAAAARLTPAAALLTLYGKVVERWGSGSGFTMNVPLFNRAGVGPALADVVADFTSLVMVQITPDATTGLAEEVRRVQCALHEAISHDAYSGVDVQRSWLREHPGQRTMAPVVFSCNIGVELFSPLFTEAFGQMGFMVSQTPQVWLDFQLFTVDGELLLIWDAVEQLFHPEVLDAMFTAFVESVTAACAPDFSWSQPLEIVIDEMLQVRAALCSPPMSLSCETIHEPVFAQALRCPEASALVDGRSGETTTRAELADAALRVAAYLHASGVGPGQLVAVELSRGVSQVIGALGVLGAGATYVPIRTDQPLARKQRMYRSGGITHVLTDQDPETVSPEIMVHRMDTALDCEPLTSPVPVSGDELAYVIFTSGSTGEPKGVEISHRACRNTLEAVVCHNQITEDDRVLMVSSFDFDLSVFDIFGMLGAGASAVCLHPDDWRDAEAWVKMCVVHRVSVWNSVPALLKMLLINAQVSGQRIDDLRVVLLSGDWIGLDLPGLLDEVSRQGHIIAMGGATEAAIWSNEIDVPVPVPQAWISIPYGVPLPGQSYRVVDELGRDCPDRVTGELWIGGAGVARGYCGDSRKNAECFVTHAGQRWYRTGDYGRFWPDGILEFLGRRDQQVKVRGHRIELEEVETAVAGLEHVADCAVVTTCIEDVVALSAFVVPSKKPEPLFKARASANLEGFTGLILDLENHQQARETELCTQDHVLRAGLSSILAAREAEGRESPVPSSWQARLLDAWRSHLVSPQEPGVPDKARLTELEEFCRPWVDEASELLDGTLTALDFRLRHPQARPELLAAAQPFVVERNQWIVQVVSQWQEQNETGRVLLCGIRDTHLVEKLLLMFEGTEHEVIIADEDPELLEQWTEAGYLTRGWAWVDRHGFDRLGGYDLVICVDSCHRSPDVVSALAQIYAALRGGGWLVCGETTVNLPIQMLLIDLLDGPNAVTDCRAGKGRLMDITAWIRLAAEVGFVDTRNAPGAQLGQGLFVARRPGLMWSVDLEVWEKELGKILPEYMVPRLVTVLDELPVTANGKIDRRLLSQLSIGTETSAQAPDGVIEKRLAALWAELLGRTKISRTDNFLELGGDSLSATVMAVRVNKEFGCHIGLDTIFSAPCLHELASAVVESSDLAGVDRLGELPQAVSDFSKRHEPFGLTEIQQAYWLGRTGLYAFGGVSTHCYFEMAAPCLDIERAERAWNQLVRTHDMLRAVLSSDGSSQRVLEQVPDYRFRTVTGEPDAREILRNELSAAQVDLTSWPLFAIGVSGAGDDRVLHLSFDNTTLDGFSIFTLFAQWRNLYDDPSSEIPLAEITFRDYVQAVEMIQGSSVHRADLDYWMQRVVSLPPAPALPINSGATTSRFRRREARLAADRWARLRALAAQHQISPSAVLMGAYAEVLSRWSESKRFTINLTRFNKLPLHPQVEHLVGDFTSLTLLGLDWRGKNFGSRCADLQARLWQDLAHPTVSGVTVLREWTRLHPELGNQPGMPVVFTSGLGLSGARPSNETFFGPILRGNSQTPQVWLDEQVSEQDGELLVSWDIADEVIEPAIADAMFDAMLQVLEHLADEDDAFDRSATTLVPLVCSQQRIEANHTGVQRTPSDLLSPLWKWVDEDPDAALVISDERTLSRAETESLAQDLAARLRATGVRAGDIVVVAMPRSWRQVVAVSGVMMAGAAYLPLDPRGPTDRIARILDRSRAVAMVTDDEVQEIINVHRLPTISVDDLIGYAPGRWQRIAPDPRTRAYVIFTSGSTGEPKGVVMTHDAVANTIEAVNRTLDIGPEDRTLMLSNLSFDLSVYDIFGMFHAGGAVVMGTEADHRNPEAWIDLVARHRVSVWNSVPMFMSMMALHLDSHSGEFPGIRRVMLSGDWIPLDLPAAVQRYFPNAKLISLGGATEAAIWSNSFPVTEVDPGWRSIPYGKPLANQMFRILDEVGDDVPDMVAGDLCIAGAGLADGYLNDPTSTGLSFVVDPRTGERLYRTGDRARYMGDGNVEFLGRADSQVKVGGHRIELGEIEAALSDLDWVRNAAVSTIGGRESRQLVAHLVLEDGMSAMTSKEQLVISKAEVVDADQMFSAAVEAMARRVLASDWQVLTGRMIDPVDDVDRTMREAGIHPTMIHLARNQLRRLDEEPVAGWESVNDPVVEMLEAKLVADRPTRLAMLRGQVDAVTVLSNPGKAFTPAELGKLSAARFASSTRILVEACDALRTEAHHVMVINGRLGLEPRVITENPGDVPVIVIDESASMLGAVTEQFGTRVSTRAWDWRTTRAPADWEPVELVVADNALHRASDLPVMLRGLREVMDDGAHLVLREQTRNTTLMLLTTALFAGGYGDLIDQRAVTHLPLLGEQDWIDALDAAGFTQITSSGVDGAGMVVLCARVTGTSRVSPSRLATELAETLPSYMVPSAVICHDQFPQTPNGKLDRKLLEQMGVDLIGGCREIVAPRTVTERAIAPVWARVLRLNEDQVGVHDSFFSLGGDSLRALQLVAGLQPEFGTKVSLEILFDHPTLADLAACLDDPGEVADQFVDDFEFGEI
mgnify:CR=1 FL=1